MGDFLGVWALGGTLARKFMVFLKGLFLGVLVVPLFACGTGPWFVDQSECP